MTQEDQQIIEQTDVSTWKVGQEVHNLKRMEELARASTQTVFMKDRVYSEIPEPLSSLVQYKGKVIELEVRIAPASFKQRESRTIMVNDYDPSKGESVVNFARLTRTPDYKIVCEAVSSDEQTRLKNEIALAIRGEGVMPDVYPLGDIKGDKADLPPIAKFVMSEKIISSDVEGVIK